MVYEKQSMGADANLHQSLADKWAYSGSRPLSRIIGILVITLLVGSSAFADFFVQPMILKRQVQPGKRIALEFKLENLSRDAADAVQFRIAGLTQDANGVWEEIEPSSTNPNASSSALRSCKDWIYCPVESAQLDPYQMVPLTLIATIPSGTRGYYFAALIAESMSPEEQPDGVTAMFSLQYLVPIILECQGLPPRHKISLTDVSLAYQPPTVDKPAPAVIATLDITNDGRTYSRLMPQVRVWQHMRGHWQKVADLTLAETGIIPGVTLHLKQDLGTLLADGKCKMEGFLWVDGRRGNAISKEFDFKGDSRITGGKIGVPIDLESRDLFVDVAPGSSRAGRVHVGNASEEQINITTEVVVPAAMTQARTGTGINGDDLSCADWVTVNPSSFTLDRYGRRYLNVVVRTPDSANMYSHYYATLRLNATYADGSSGGMREVSICLNNAKGTGTHQIEALMFTLAEASPSRYFATATFRNQGVTHIKPQCRGILTEAGTGDLWKKFLMTSEAFGQTGIFLPFESRPFQGILDVAGVAAGFYRLTAILDVPGGNVQSQQLIEVFEQGGRKMVRSAPWEKAPDGKGKLTISL